jgi:hypothetical protein
MTHFSTIAPRSALLTGALAAVLAGAALSTASAQTTSASAPLAAQYALTHDQSPPVVNGEYSFAHPKSEAPVLSMEFRNETQVVADTVGFTVDLGPGNAPKTIVERGYFSPGITIARRYVLASHNHSGSGPAAPRGTVHLRGRHVLERTVTSALSSPRGAVAAKAQASRPIAPAAKGLGAATQRLNRCSAPWRTQRPGMSRAAP